MYSCICIIYIVGKIAKDVFRTYFFGLKTIKLFNIYINLNNKFNFNENNIMLSDLRRIYFGKRGFQFSFHVQCQKV